MTELPSPLKVATWNLNGLRARAAQLVEFLENEKPDILCLQEIRVTQEQIPMDLVEVEGYTSFWHGGPKGYSGVALHLSKRMGEPRFFHPEFDFEARVVGAEIGDFVLYSIYVPNGGKDFVAKMNFLEALEKHMAELVKQGKQVILCGDLNLTHSDMDVHPKERKGSAVGQLPPERELFHRILASGYTDIQRNLYPEDAEIFTWWAPWRNLRQRNIGWRIDYILATGDIAAKSATCVSQREFGTSDHAPVVAVFQ